MIISNSNYLNKKSLSEWLATGFFFNQQSINHNTEDFIGYNAPTIKWHYSPQYFTFDETLKKFSKLFEELINREIEGHKIILPLSGGLDSRTLAAALIGKKNVTAYSYEFVGGIKETEYARKIAEICGWNFHSFKISPSKSYFIDQYSSLEIPLVTRIINQKGNVVVDILKSTNPLTDYNIGLTELFQIKTEKNIFLNGRLIKPYNFDKNKKYPTLIYVYNGPGVQLIRNNWLASSPLLRSRLRF